MKERSYGSEAEYVSSLGSDEELPEYGTSLLTPDGGRFYKDMEYGEYSTPETRTPGELVIREWAGQGFVLGHTKGSIYKTSATRLVYKGHGAGHQEEVSHGHHTNYSVSLGYDGKAMEIFMLDRNNHPSHGTEVLDFFLAISPPLYGSGHIDLKGDYRVSKRHGFVTLDSGRRTIKDSSVFYINSGKGGIETCIAFMKGSHGKEDRLQIAVQDALMSQRQRCLSVAVTSLVLDLIEDGLADIRADYGEILRIFHELPYSYDNFGSFKMDAIVDGKNTKMTLPEAQMYFTERAASRTHNTPVIRKWQHLVEALKSGDYMELRREYDWATKLWWFGEMKEKSKRDPTGRMREQEMLYHKLDREGERESVYDKLADAGYVDVMFKNMEQSGSYPPKSRARGRVLAARYGLRPDFGSWRKSLAIDAKATAETKKIEMPHPWPTYETEVKDFAAANRLKPADILALPLGDEAEQENASRDRELWGYGSAY